MVCIKKIAATTMDFTPPVLKLRNPRNIIYLTYSWFLSPPSRAQGGLLTIISYDA